MVFSALKRLIREITLPFVRMYIRYFPLRFGKVTFFQRIAGPYFFMRPHEFSASTVHGVRVKGNARDYIQAWVYFFGLTEPSLTNWIEGSLRPGDTFVDVGANIGCHSLLASKLVGSIGSVVAIEASPSIFEVLKRNIALNRVHNVRAVNMAASDQRGVLKFYRAPSHDLGSSTTCPELGKEGYLLEAEVEAAPLGEILSPTELSHARVIKIDVEGAEAAVVRGLAAVLDQCRPDLEIVVEIIPKYLAVLNKTFEDVLGIFGERGFHAYGLKSEYGPEPFLAGQPGAKPTRIRQPITDDTNVILSRRDVDEL